MIYIKKEDLLLNQHIFPTKPTPLHPKQKLITFFSCLVGERLWPCLASSYASSSPPPWCSAPGRRCPPATWPLPQTSLPTHRGRENTHTQRQFPELFVVNPTLVCLHIKTHNFSYHHSRGFSLFFLRSVMDQKEKFKF